MERTANFQVWDKTSRVRLLNIVCLLEELLCYSVKKSSRIGHSQLLFKEIVLRFCTMPLKHPWLKPYLVMIPAVSTCILTLSFITDDFLTFSQNMTKLFFNNSPIYIKNGKLSRILPDVY